MQSSTKNNTQGLLTSFQTIAYSFPLFSISFLTAPIALLQGIYAKHFGLSLTTIATVLLIARIFDAVTDPLIGYCADRYYARRNSRKPFVVVGAMLFIFSSWFLYAPSGFDPEQGQSSVSAAYFLCWFLVFYLGYTLFEIPHMAWGGELATDSREKNTIYGVRSFIIFLSSLLFFAIPLLPWFENSEFTPQTLAWSVLVAGLLMLPLLYICIRYVPNKPVVGFVNAYHGHLDGSDRKESLPVVLRTIFSNKPLLVLLGAFIFTGSAMGMYFALLFIFVDVYLGLGHHLALILVVGYSMGLVALKFWVSLAKYWSKQSVWIASLFLVISGTVGLGFLSPDSTNWIELLVCIVLIFSGNAAFNVMAPSLLSDIIDYGTWKFGTDRAGTYFSLYVFTNKAMIAFSGALALGIAGWAGFDPTETVHSDESVMALRFGISWMPVLFILLSMALIARIPITAHRHSVIRRRLDSRAKRRFRTEQIAYTSTDLNPDIEGVVDSSDPSRSALKN